MALKLNGMILNTYFEIEWHDIEYIAWYGECRQRGVVVKKLRLYRVI